MTQLRCITYNVRNWIFSLLYFFKVHQRTLHRFIVVVRLPLQHISLSDHLSVDRLATPLVHQKDAITPLFLVIRFLWNDIGLLLSRLSDLILAHFFASLPQLYILWGLNKLVLGLIRAIEEVNVLSLVLLSVWSVLCDAADWWNRQSGVVGLGWSWLVVWRTCRLSRDNLYFFPAII